MLPDRLDRSTGGAMVVSGVADATVAVPIRMNAERAMLILRMSESPTIVWLESVSESRGTNQPCLTETCSPQRRCFEADRAFARVYRSE